MEQEQNLKLGLVTETNNEYHSDLSAISKSRLAKMSVCPKYFKWCEDNPSEPTEDLIVGSAFHKYVLELDTFDDEFIISPDFNLRKKDEKEQSMQFEENAKANGKQVITQKQFDIITGMKNAVMSKPRLRKALQGIHEQSMYGVDELTGERIKTRPDCYKIIERPNDDGEIERLCLITDLKSCRSAEMTNFNRDCVKYHYILQLYMYCYNASKVLNIPMENITFLFIAVEKTPPHLIKTYECKFGSKEMQSGEQQFREYIGMYHEAKTTNNWWDLDGEYDIISELSLPDYLLKTENNN